MSTDNRTIINDCEANTGWSGSDAATAVSDAGLFFQGSNALATQYSNVDEDMSTTQDSVGAGTFSLDWSDSTLYMIIKDNLNQAFSAGGVQFIIGDATPDTIGYDVGGDDARGVPLSSAFSCYRLDVSVIVATPGTFQVIAGAEASLDQTACTHIGYGGIHASKAVGAVDNCWMDCFRYIANGSYALTINGGTVGTPETMADVVGDDATGGWGMVANPLGDQFLFAAPAQWGDVGTANSYFTADNEQWYLVGDNGGGHAIGVGNFPFRLIGNGTGTNSWVVNGTVIINTGTRAEILMDDSNMDIIQLNGCQVAGAGTIGLPSAGGTTRETLDTIFSNCDQITNNGADMTGCSILASNVAANLGALLYNEVADPDGTLDNLTITKTAGTAHHAIEFGTSIATSAITLRNCNFGTGFSSSENTSPTAEAGDETFAFRDTTGTLTVNLVNCTGNFGYYSAGVVITKVVDPVSVGLSGVTEGTPVTIIADETVGTITKGDVILSAFADSAGAVSVSFDYEGAFDPSGLDVLVRARNQGVAVAAIAEDGGAFTDETDEAHSNTTGDMTLLPAVPVAGDAYNFGHNEQFPRLKLNISTVLTQSSAPTFAFEYWNGAWVALSGVVDGTAGYENTGQNIISWTMPGDWATTTINGQGPLYYMRIRITAVGTITQVPVGARVQLDVSRYLPYFGERIIVSGTGLADIAAWTRDTISKFDPND